MAKRPIDNETIQIALLCNTIFNIAVLGFASYGIFVKNVSSWYWLGAIVLMWLYAKFHESLIEAILDR